MSNQADPAAAKAPDSPETDDPNAKRRRVHDDIWWTPPQQLGGGFLVRTMMLINHLLTQTRDSRFYATAGYAPAWPITLKRRDGSDDPGTAPIDQVHAAARLTAIAEELDARLPPRDDGDEELHG